MAGIDKILVVIVLVFSVVFVVAAINGYNKAQDNYQARDQKIENLDKQVKREQVANAEARNDLAKETPSSAS